MKNIINRGIIGILSLILVSMALLFISGNVFASSTRNIASNSCSTNNLITPASIYNSCSVVSIARNTNSSSSVMLNIKDKYKSIGKGNIVEYTITYKNIGKTTLSNPILQVIIPKGIVVTNTSAGAYTQDTRTLTVELNNLKKGVGGILYVQGRVQSVPTNVSQVVTTALLVYTNTNKAQENAIAYVLNTPKVLNDGNSLGATAFFSGLAGLTLVGLLLIIILILVIILIVRQYFYNPTAVEVIHETTKKK